MKSIYLWLATTQALIQATAQQFPYNPTTAFISPEGDTVYILLPSSPANTNGELLSVNISTQVKTSQVLPTVLTKGLPFLEEGSGGDDKISFAPAMTGSGGIGVYAGSCSSHSSLWMYHPQNAIKGTTSPSKTGKWAKLPTSNSSSAATSSELYNANFLASGFFSSLAATGTDDTDTNAAMYILGGMCPTTANTNASTWQSSAIYSNSMLKLSPPDGSNTQYHISLSAGSSPKPVPEAGHTLTGLLPTSSNSSTGAMTQEQTYVLIGGQTSDAFIGMDRVGLFSLPDETWTFQSISSQAVVGGGELAVIKSSLTSESGMPDSRSGHTALLSVDGSRIVVFGGWVGDVGTAAEPQLVVLKLGSGARGDEWEWEIPNADPSRNGLGAGEGIYGHGAVMLPGGVMMVVGGYTISPSSTKMAREDAKLRMLFFNTTSMAWMDQYTNPSLASPGPGSASTTDSTTADSAVGSDSRKVKIGVGAGIGAAVAIGIAIFCFWYARKLRAKRVEERDRSLQVLGQTAHREGRDSFYGPYNSNGEMVQRQHSQNLGNRSMGVGYRNSSGVYEPLPYGGAGGYDYDDERNTSYVVPGPRNSFTIPRKPANLRNGRGYSQQQQQQLVMPNQYSSFDFGTGHARANSLGTAGMIHPIYEADEDDEGADAGVLSVGLGQAVEYPPASTNDYSDPFMEAPQGMEGSVRPRPYELHHPGTQDRNTPSPDSPAKEREREVEEWIADWAAAEALMARSHSLSQSGRLSPGKESVSNSNSGRTASNLSERSAVTLSRSGSQATRSNSLTAFFSGAGGGWNPFASNGNAGMSARSGSVGRRVEVVRGGDVPRSGRATAEEAYGNGNGSVSPTSERSGGTLTVPGPPRSAGSGSQSGVSGTASFVTAQSGTTSFSALRVEAETLLPRPRTGEWERGWESGSPSKRKERGKGVRRRGSWLGSLKRVFGQEEWVGSLGVGEGEGEGMERYVDSPSPTREGFGGWNEPYRDEEFGPRRAGSAGGVLLRRKQGRGDWEDSVLDEGGKGRYSAMGTESSGMEVGEEEEEWDVEEAVRGRVVQVMFTVPKERLRVVNQDQDVGEEEEGDIGMVRGGSPVRGKGEEKVDEDGEGKGEERGQVSRKSTPVTPVSSRPSSPAKSLRGKRVQEIVEQMERREGM